MKNNSFFCLSNYELWHFHLRLLPQEKVELGTALYLTCLSSCVHVLM